MVQELLCRQAIWPMGLLLLYLMKKMNHEKILVYFGKQNAVSNHIIIYFYRLKEANKTAEQLILKAQEKENDLVELRLKHNRYYLKHIQWK